MSSTFLSNMDAGNVSHYLALANITPTSTFGTAPTTIATITVQPESFPDPGQMITWRGILMATAATNTLRLYINGTVIMTISFTNQGNTTAGSGGWNLTLQRKNSTTLTLIPTFLGQ